MKFKLSFLLILTCFILMYSCNVSSNQTNSSANGGKSEEDFKTVKIGNQKWMAENLNVVLFRNGDSIQEIKNDEDWKKAGDEKKPAWSYYEYNSENGATFGKLYNWYALNDSRGLCPVGWHVPSLNEWQELQDFLGGDRVAGEKLKSEKVWNGVNSYDFSALPGGYLDFGAISRKGPGMIGGTFEGLRHSGLWWTSTENKSDAQSAYYCSISKDNTSLNLGTWVSSPKGGGLSIRCIADKNE
jgi:uncharacterized protein (TIGR02145 family)